MARIDRLLRSPQAAVFAACAVLAATPLALFGPAVIDDAYITFRYAENISSGKGFVFNAADGPILGTSTPLFTLLLALGRVLGIPIPGFALTLSVLGAALTFFSGTALVRRTGAASWPTLAGLGWAVVLTTSPQWIIILQSGMETMLFVGLAMSALAAATARRPLAASALAGLTVLTRYDGWALALIVLAWIAWESRRRAWGAFVLFAATQIPWATYALSTFGSYAPHSVAAKRAIHPRAFTENLAAQARFLIGNLEGWEHVARFNLYLAPFFLVGVALLALRRRRALVLPVWALASVLGFAAGRILIQNWYLAPLLAAYSWTAIWGVWALCAMRQAQCQTRSEKGEPGAVGALPAAASSPSALRDCFAWLLPTLVVVVLLAVHLKALLPDRREWPRKLVHREQTYFQASEWVRRHAPSGSSVLVGEVGAIAWALPEYRIIDSSGINSDGVLKARQADRRRIERSGVVPRIPDSGTPEWVRETIRQERPDYLVSIDALLHLDALSKEPWFDAAYEQQAIYRLRFGERGVAARVSIYARRESGRARLPLDQSDLGRTAKP